MTIETIHQYIDKVFKFIDSYKSKIESFQKRYQVIVISSIALFKHALYACLNIIKSTGKIARYTTFPFHWLGIYFELKKMLNRIEDIPIFTLGAHYFYGKPGSGKSTVVYHAMMDYAYMTGKCSYTTALMETPRKDIYGREYYYHQLFEPSDFFKNGEQVAGFDNNFNLIVYEEMLTQYHQRNNKERSYNDEVLPMISAMGTQRHQGIDLFYFISQLPKNDISIMQMLAGYHEPKIKKVFDYKHWLETGLFRFRIKGWKMISYDVQIKSNYDFELVNKRRWFYTNIYPEDMKYFNRLNMQKHFSKLEKAKGREMYAWVDY